MSLSYFKSTFRSFRKDRIYSLINLSGLVVGLAACLFITLHVLEELSYDKFHPASERSYRVVMDMFNKNELSAKSAPVFAAIGPNLVADFPEIEEMTRILPFGNGVYSVKAAGNHLLAFNEERAVFADPNFFELMGFTLLRGAAKEVLSQKNQIVISESTSKRYFGETDAIGQTIIYRGEQELIVSGIMADFPEQSHLQFDMITSLMSWNGYDSFPENWGWYDFYTYVIISPGTDVAALKGKLAGYLDEKKAETYAETGNREVLELQNISDVHLYSKGYSWEMGQNGGADRVYFLGAIALLILIIAWVNFINLSTARAAKRAREVGVRKVVGASRTNLVIQFLTETFLYNVAAVVLAVSIVLMTLPVVNYALDISLETRLLGSPIVLSGLLCLILLGTFVSGFYPALVLTQFDPIHVLKGNLYNRRASFGFRKILVVFQFAISTILILGTLLVVKQLHYMTSQDLGLSVEQTLVLKAPSSSRGENDLEERQKIFAARLEQTPGVQGFTVSNIVPGLENFSITGYRTRENPSQQKSCYRVRIDENYFPDFDIDIIAGRNFQKGMASDTNAVILNREATRLLGFRSPEAAIGEMLNPQSPYSWRIVGIAENYHHSSLKEALDPIVFSYRPGRGDYLSVKLDAQNQPQTLSFIEGIWKEIYPDNPYDYFFLDAQFDQQYKTDRQFTAVFIAFAGIAIFVAFIGLFGLVSFTIEQSRKEIGIRKVLGASTGRLVLLFARDYAGLIALSIVIAFPLGYYLMNRWLNDFAYRTDIGVPLFVVGALAITGITFLTVSIKSIAAAQTNPVKVLRE